ncbi:uncharacterized protein LOC126685774 isoform X2 [Mercurialis annua]|uniref:uncharacterized protein LOC126685774 isoform X2 n=1 Tax=Mercurialis annua TaxID=3986 RepID=UPI00215F1185|nr:uncharacterized protein LOC126685774 isoform X2 [Mercurialis annua]
MAWVEQICTGLASNGNEWKRTVLILYVIICCSVPLAQCFLGSDVLRWRSFYATQDDVWKAHYHEVFDYGIREALCCLGRMEYLGVYEEDEVYSVARLLGDLVAYRALGTGHLELLAGLALLQKHSGSSKSYEGAVEAPKELIQEAFTFHEFAEAAYTGPLLDFGRHNVFFPCAWVYRQGILSPWTRNRRPMLKGDNWWRGHAAAFLKYVNLPPEVLRQGRVCQGKCKAAYFTVVLHHIRSVVIAVRGTETAEDLITDGLGRECPLNTKDLDGLIKSNLIPLHVKQSVELSFPHYGHSGVVEAARDLYMQIEGNPGDKDAELDGLLSSLLGAGCECDGYSINIVGHSLGGAIAALLGIRLYRQYPKLHVYAFGPLPCVDSIIAEACSDFVTSIVHDNEFSARLSVGSILRLRAASIMALSEDSSADRTLIFRLARRFLSIGNCETRRTDGKDSSEFQSPVTAGDDLNYEVYRGTNKLDNSIPLWKELGTSSASDTDNGIFENLYNEPSVVNPLDNPVSQFFETVPQRWSSGDPPEMFLPGLVVHMVPKGRNTSLPLWKSWRSQESGLNYNACLAKREDFKDIVVSPNMFLDHLPWRCHNTMQKILEARNKNAMDETQIV